MQPPLPAGAYAPAAHSPPQLVLPLAGWKVPAAQGEQADDAAAPGTTEYWPAPQPVHCAAPAAAAYRPSPQRAHTADAVAPVATDPLPAAHSVQPLAPVPDW